MPTYLLSFRVPGDYVSTPDLRERWHGFFAGISDHLEEIGNPIFSRRSIGDTGAGTVLGGYTLVNADNLEQATALAAGCPMIGHGGGVDVGELAPLTVPVRASSDPRPIG